MIRFSGFNPIAGDSNQLMDLITPMFDVLKEQKLRISLILGIFIIFLCNATGLFSVGMNMSSQFSVHNSLLKQIVSEGFLPQMVGTAEFVSFLLTGLVLSLLLPILSPIKASALALISIFPPMMLELRIPVSEGMLPMEYSLLTILVLFGVNVLLGYFAETHEKQKLLVLFGQYVPKELVETLNKHPEQASMAGASRDMTVMFCDIKGFTKISENLEPSQLAQLLNLYFTSMTRVLYKHGATIDKYMGDAIMAFWGAPIQQPDHASRAVAAALEMQLEIRRLKYQFRDNGWPRISLGIGISSGEMAVGNMGSEYRIAYTVVGDVVNLGSRLEHLTRTYHSDIIVSEQTRKSAPDFVFRELDLVMVRGKARTTRIYQPQGKLDRISQTLQQQLQLQQQALEFYYAKQWQQAEATFTKLIADEFNPRYCQLMLNRIAAFISKPPSESWQGATKYEQTASFKRSET